jgi:dextranase
LVSPRGNLGNPSALQLQSGLHDEVMRIRLLLPFVFLYVSCAHAQRVQLVDSYPQRARFSPSETVNLLADLDGEAEGAEKLSATIWRLGKEVGECGPIQLSPGATGQQTLRCSLPPADFQGYFVTVQLTSGKGGSLGERQTAIDISSDWKRFPRYGYLAHYNSAHGAHAKSWIDELNRFHINGLEFYDFQFRHDQPLAGTVDHPASNWKDIAGRTIEATTVNAFIDRAHFHNMMAMAYNASYSAYDDAFVRQHDSLPLKWATWKSPDGPRTVATAKSLDLHAPGWSTSRLYYMNQSDPGWQHYLFGQMNDLFKVYPFDGWHIDTFGEKGGYNFDGSYVDYISGFRSYIDQASASLHKRIVFNAVNTMGQEHIAHSAAEFVYSELWEDHETFASILETTEQVHLANPQDGFVIAAYVSRRETSERSSPIVRQFNMPSVLLTDAAIFASGASHIELGDGDRMLSSEYFPADTALVASAELRDALRHYYDYLTAYENFLRDGVSPISVEVRVSGQPVDPLAVPNTLWTIGRQKDDATMVHIINLLGSDDPHWRDLGLTRPEPPVLKSLRVQVSSTKKIHSAGWASPDIDGGQFHAIPFEIRHQPDADWIELTLPELHYWDTVFLLP